MIADPDSTCGNGSSGHVAIAGGMYVDSEDIHTVAQARRDNGCPPIACETCDGYYVIEHGWLTS